MNTLPSEAYVYELAKRYLRARLADHDLSEGGEGYDSGALRRELMARLCGEELAAVPLGMLFDALGLGDFGRFVFVYALFSVTDAGVAEALSVLAGEKESGFVTPRMLCTLFSDTLRYRDVYGEFSEGSALGELVFCKTPSSDRDRLVPDPRLVSYAFGSTDTAYGPMCRRVANERMPRTDGETAARLARFVSRCRERDVHGRLLLRGEMGVGKRSLAAGCAFLAGAHPVLILELSSEDARRMRMPLLREALLQGAIPVLAGVGSLCENEKSRFSLAEYLDRVASLFPYSFVLCETACRLPRGNVPCEEYAYALMPMTMERAVHVWEEEAGDYRLSPELSLRELSGEFRMTPGTVKAALAAADIEASLAGRSAIGASELKSACYRLLDEGLDEKATRLPCFYTWDDLILPDHAKALLKTACDQVRYRYRVYGDFGFDKKIAYGRGVSMAFSGPPGTGKTMAAQIVASELELMLYRVDLAAVVSKYVGETEKNLNAIFEKARKSRVVLFFDEADVLFSKRTEVKDANDKYNNMEAAFLLQKMEEYEGITVLATNYIQNFDEAFKRRLRFLIDFPFPGAAERRAIWKRVFPAEAPLGDLDMEYLSERFELSGSNIRNISLHAAFLAAGEDAPRIEMRHILHAVKNEYRKAGKVFSKEDAGEYFMLL